MKNLSRFNADERITEKKIFNRHKHIYNNVDEYSIKKQHLHGYNLYNTRI